MTEETKSSPSAVEEGFQIHEDVAETALKDTIDNFLPGNSEPAETKESDKDEEEDKK
jgi:hypothetical protein